MYRIPSHNLFSSYVIGGQLTVAGGMLLLGLKLFTMLGILTCLVYNTFSVAYFFESIR